MTKVEAIKKVLEDNNGVATWDIIYKEIVKYYPNAHLSKEWQAGIRGVYYRALGQYFKQVGYGICGLIDYKEETLSNISDKPERIHGFMEGICIELGNLFSFDTYTADPSSTFNSISLNNITTQNNIPNFTYNDIIDSVKNIDVIWFNKKGFQFPRRAFEIVDSIGTLEPALKRMYQLNEFNLDFYIITKNDHIKKVNKELNKAPYKDIRNRYLIRGYEEIQEYYNKLIVYKDNDKFFNF